MKDVRVAGSTENENFTRIPSQDELTLNPAADYVHICQNNTIFGTAWHTLPETGSVPLVADLSSCILSEPVDVSKYGIIYAGVQKNMAPAGFAVVIVRDDLIGNPQPICPKIWDFGKQAEKNSMLNTPPTWSIYICKLVLEWIMGIGGLQELKKRNEKKAALLYDYLDSQSFYKAQAQKESRSMMNVTFRTGDDELDKKFVALVGGMRASIYNAMPYEGVEALVDFMKKFAREQA